MTPRSTRKKPVCQKCGHFMAGHKRPYGAPVCPRDDSASASPQPATRKTFKFPPFEFNPTSYAKQTRSYVAPERGPSRVSTEHDDSQGTPSRQQPLRSPPPAHEVIDVDAEDGIEEVEHKSVRSQEIEHEYNHEYEPSEPAEGHDSDTSSNGSSSMILNSSVIGRRTSLASIYATPRERVPTITTATRAEGLNGPTVEVHNAGVEPTGFKQELATPVRTFAPREGLCMIAVGRDLTINVAIPPKPTMRPRPEGMLEPYDYDRGLGRERNERVGSYPDNPQWIRNTFFNTLVVSAVSALVMFYLLSEI